MIVELDRKDIVNLLTSLTPMHSDMNKLIDLGFGEHIGGFNDKWEWRSQQIFTSNLSDEEIYALYKHLK